MPFTLSHAAAAIPFRRTRLIASAVVMGCFVPDFPHFLSLLSAGMPIGHTFAGVFVFDLPLATAALWLFHGFIKRPMLMFLPAGILRRLTTSVTIFPFWPRKRLLLIVLSILTGTATHLLWDAFTHRDSWVYQNWTFLQKPVDLPLAGEMQMDKILEYASSISGIAMLAVWIWHWYRTTTPASTPAAHPVDAVNRRALVAGLPVLAMLGGALRAYQDIGIYLHLRPMAHFLADMLISATTFFLLGLLAYGVILRRQTGPTVTV